MRRFPGSGAARALFVTAALFAFVMAVLPHPPRLPGAPSDKLQHIVAFAVLGALAAAAYPRVRLRTVLLGLAFLGGAIEIVQLIPALNRDGDVIDWIADVAAAALAAPLVRGLLKTLGSG